MSELLDFLGWDGLSYADQQAVLFYCALGAVAGFALALLTLALFRFSPASPKTPAKKKKRKKKRGRR